MSESRTNLEQILELLLAEDTEKAEELLHEYVVAKARAEYERVLDEAEDDEMEIDRGDPAGDIENEISDHENEIDSEEEGDEPADLEFDDEEEDEDGDDDVEDKVDDLEKEIEDLRAELESLIADQDMGDMEEPGMDDMDDMEEPGMDFGGEDDMEDEIMDSVEYDLDELEEATKLQDKVAEPKGGAGEGEGESPFTKAPKHSKVSSQGSPVKAKDGSEGKKDHGKGVKSQNPTDSNIDVDHKAAPAAKKAE